MIVSPIPAKYLLLVCFSLLFSFTYSQSNVDHLRLTNEQWLEDINFFANQLPQRHRNAFHRITKEQFDGQIAGLQQDMGRLNSDEVFFRLYAIAESIGDVHTRIDLPAYTAALPIVIRKYDSDFRVVSIKPGLENALGAKLLEINGASVSAVCDSLSKAVPSDQNPSLTPVFLAAYMRHGLFLHGAGITSEREAARYTLLTDEGKQLTVELQSDTSGKPQALAGISTVVSLAQEEPLDKFWIRYIPEKKTLYCNVRQIGNLRKPSKKMLELIQQYQPQKLIIDLRQNGGGDYYKGLRYLINPIRKLPTIDKKGHLYVLISPVTASAAMANATHFRSRTEATLVGQAIGEKPNGYAERRTVRLPNSRLLLSYSVKIYNFVQGENIVKPDVEIIPTFNDVRAGIDPVIEWVFNQSMQ